MKKIILVLLASTLLLANITLATRLPTFTRPATCPSSEALKNAHLNISARDKVSWFAQDRHNTFDTQDDWFLFFFPFKAKDLKAAYDYTQAVLARVSLSNGPFYEEYRGWSCVYVDVYGQKVTAISGWPY